MISSAHEDHRERFGSWKRERTSFYLCSGIGKKIYDFVDVGQRARQSCGLCELLELLLQCQHRHFCRPLSGLDFVFSVVARVGLAVTGMGALDKDCVVPGTIGSRCSDGGLGPLQSLTYSSRDPNAMTKMCTALIQYDLVGRIETKVAAGQVPRPELGSVGELSQMSFKLLQSTMEWWVGERSAAPSAVSCHAMPDDPYQPRLIRRGSCCKLGSQPSPDVLAVGLITRDVLRYLPYRPRSYRLCSAYVGKKQTVAAPAVFSGNGP